MLDQFKEFCEEPFTGALSALTLELDAVLIGVLS